MPIATQGLTPALLAEVLPFAARQGVHAYLRPVLEMTERIFPEAIRFNLFIEDDPEILDDSHLVVEVLLPALEPDQYVEAKFRWSDALFQICPAPLVCVFRCRLRIVEP